MYFNKSILGARSFVLEFPFALILQEYLPLVEFTQESILSCLAPELTLLVVEPALWESTSSDDKR